MSRRWPFPGDLPVDRARQVAQQYRDVLWRVNAEACTAVDRAAALAGEEWVLHQAAIETDDDLVTVARGAELVGRSVRWVYTRLGKDVPAVRRAGQPTLFRLGDLRSAVAHERARRKG